MAHRLFAAGRRALALLALALAAVAPARARRCAACAGLAALRCCRSPAACRNVVLGWPLVAALAHTAGAAALVLLLTLLLARSAPAARPARRRGRWRRLPRIARSAPWPQTLATPRSLRHALVRSSTR